jgi:AcrR family transcriptional regulator
MQGGGAAPAGAKRKRIVKAAEDRRADLLEAGLRVLRERGSEATVADITAAAEVAKGTFYLYFDSKEDLVAALRRQLDESFLIAVVDGLDLAEAADWWRLIERMVGQFVDFLLDIADVHDVLYHGGPGRTPTERPDGIDLLADFLRGGTEAGAFAVDDPEAFASLLFSAVHGAVDVAIVRGEVDRDRIVAAATELTRRALSP